MTTYHEETEFIKAVIDTDLLSKAIEWIKENLSPEEVFIEGELVEWVGDHCAPEDVFEEEKLKAWAEDKGFVEKGE